MGTKIYVGNLPFSVVSQDLERAFAGHGTVVSATVLTDRDTGRSRGFGFVEMENAEQAKAAIEAVNGSELGGRQLVVNEARPTTGRSGDRFGPGRGRRPSYGDRR